MRNLRKLLPGAKREPKVVVVFANRQEACDRLIRHVRRRQAAEGTTYPIYAYCLEQPHEAQRCARVVVDADPRRLYRQAQVELADVWVALSATTWNHVSRGTLIKLIPLTIPPFRGVVGNENGDFFPLGIFPTLRHMADRF